MITAGDFRKGITVEIDGSVFVIVDFLHVKPGKGAAFVRTKLKNVMTARCWSAPSTLRTNIRLRILSVGNAVFIRGRRDILFMDNETYDQLPLNKEEVESALPFMKENDNVNIKFYKGTAFRLSLRICRA